MNASADRRTRGDRIVLRSVVQFGIAGLIALIVVGLATQFASRAAGERSAVDQARSTALLRAQMVSRYVTPKLLVGDPGAIDRLNRIMTRSVLNRSIVRVKIWMSDGTILYSDEKRLIGRRFALGHDEAEVVRSDRRVVAGVSNLSSPENQFERRDRKLLEVYAPMRPFPGARLLFEAYFRYDAVSSAGARLYQNTAPWTIGALIVLQLVQLPLAWSLARRLQRRQRESERVLRQALEASTVERRRVAADLHDGVVQGLAGAAFTLGGIARRPDLDADVAQLLSRTEHELRDGVQALRSLLVEIYPPNLFEEGIAAALDDLVARLRTSGVNASLDLAHLDRAVPETASALTFRAAQEAVRNVTAHSHATRAQVALATTASGIELRVSDNGVGCDPAAVLTAPSDGHFGLRGIRDLVAEAGGSFTLDAKPGVGTSIRIEVPVS